VGAGGAFVFAEIIIFRAIISGEVIATGVRVKAGIRIMGAGFKRIINEASEKGNSEVLLRDRRMTTSRDILLVFIGTYYGKDFT